ncbi:hypothetical protein C0992_009743, partial [Termitomyces sp. T32_za158]
MRFSTSFFAIVASILPVFAAPSPLINVVKAPGETKGGHIVTFKSGDARLSFASKANNSTLTYHYDIINGVAGKFTDEEIEELRADSGVEAIYEDGVVKISGLQTNAPWGLARLSSRDRLFNQNSQATNFAFAYKDGAGRGVDVYVLDTGIFIEHADFGGRARWGATFGNYRDGDYNGHGTHCAGTVGSMTYGVAKQANLIAVKVLGDDGKGDWSDLIAGLDWVQKSARASGRPSVASLSLGGPGSAVVDAAVAKLATVNIHAIVAAGNDNIDASTESPARVPSAITVAASNIADKQAWFSNYGRVITLYAPGQDIISTWIGNTR